jgi:hypothetical protein
MASTIGQGAERFLSKRDGWLVAVLWAASLVDVGVGLLILFGFDGVPVLLAPLLVAIAFFQLHALYGTDYTLAHDTLLVRSSFFRWRVPVAAVTSVEPTSNPLSSPACSLDRLLIRYGAKRIMISPADKAAFLRALAARAPQLVVSGDVARRRDGEPSPAPA